MPSRYSSHDRSTSRPYYDYENPATQYPADAYTNRGGFSSSQHPRPTGYTMSSRHYEYAERTPVAHHPPLSVLYDPRDPRSHHGYGNPPVPISTSFDNSRRRDDVERTPIAPHPHVQSEALRAPPNVPTAAKYECSYCRKGFNRPSSLKVTCLLISLCFTYRCLI